MRAVTALLSLDDSFARELGGLYQPWQAVVPADPRLVVLNAALAQELGVDADALRTPEGVAFLVGQGLPEAATPVAQAYAGHQFGGFSPSLGDGRALLLGEVIDGEGRRRDLHLKGSGPTPFSRGGDGKAALGPMLREYIVAEALHALGIPTTRALAVVATGEQVAREDLLAGAVLARVAASHLRVGTFEYASAHGGPDLVRRLADYAIARHDPAAGEAPNPYLAFLEGVVERQAALIARWMLVGFVHGVMNTDNTTISGETIDYGPCAFMDAYDPATVFSSIDHGGRYAYGNQPVIAQWNLARLAETLLPLLADDEETAVALATDVLHSFPDRYGRHRADGYRAKLGLVDPADPADPADGDDALIEDLLGLLHTDQVDFTSFFRALATSVVGQREPARSRFEDPAAFDAWATRWSDRLAAEGRRPEEVAAGMDRVNPVYIPRNHLVEEALAAAYEDDLAPFERLLDVLAHPFDERPDLGRYAAPAPPDVGRYRTFCGT